MKKIASIVISILLILQSAQFDRALAEKTPVILRVCVMDSKDKINLVLKGPYKIYDINSDRLLLPGKGLRADIAIAKSGLMIDKKEMNVTGVKVRVVKDSTIYVDGRRFRGAIDIVRKDDSRLNVINNIEMEDYLYGVLYHEVSHRWPIEILKAQAIAARTFALYQKRENALQPYDLRSDIYSQMYGGRTSEKRSTTKAVNATKGQILVYKGNILPAYYHATCAGHTEDAANLWNVDLEPLKGVECNFCKASPHYSWTKEIQLAVIEDKLRENGYKIGRINSIKVLSKNRSGRVDKLEIKDEAGVSLILTAKDFRQILGPNEIRSVKFDISIRWGLAIVNGFGWGHGVGMCQWGAYGLSKKHKKAEYILKYYYPGVEITTIDKLPDKT